MSLLHLQYDKKVIEMDQMGALDKVCWITQRSLPQPLLSLTLAEPIPLKTDI